MIEGMYNIGKFGVSRKKQKEYIRLKPRSTRNERRGINDINLIFKSNFQSSRLKNNTAKFRVYELRKNKKKRPGI